MAQGDPIAARDEVLRAIDEDPGYGRSREVLASIESRIARLWLPRGPSSPSLPASARSAHACQSPPRSAQHRVEIRVFAFTFAFSRSGDGSPAGSRSVPLKARARALVQRRAGDARELRRHRSAAALKVIVHGDELNVIVPLANATSWSGKDLSTVVSDLVAFMYGTGGRRTGDQLAIDRAARSR